MTVPVRSRYLRVARLERLLERRVHEEFLRAQMDTAQCGAHFRRNEGSDRSRGVVVSHRYLPTSHGGPECSGPARPKLVPNPSYLKRPAGAQQVTRARSAQKFAHRPFGGCRNHVGLPVDGSVPRAYGQRFLVADDSSHRTRPSLPRLRGLGEVRRLGRYVGATSSRGRLALSRRSLLSTVGKGQGSPRTRYLSNAGS